MKRAPKIHSACDLVRAFPRMSLDHFIGSMRIRGNRFTSRRAASSCLSKAKRIEHGV